MSKFSELLFIGDYSTPACVPDIGCEQQQRDTGAVWSAFGSDMGLR